MASHIFWNDALPLLVIIFKFEASKKLSCNHWPLPQVNVNDPLPQPRLLWTPHHLTRPSVWPDIVHRSSPAWEWVNVAVTSGSSRSWQDFSGGADTIRFWPMTVRHFGEMTTVAELSLLCIVVMVLSSVELSKTSSMKIWSVNSNQKISFWQIKFSVMRM